MADDRDTPAGGEGPAPAAGGGDGERSPEPPAPEDPKLREIVRRQLEQQAGFT